MKCSEKLINGWCIIVGIDMKGEVKFQELHDLSIKDIKNKIEQLNKPRKKLAYFGYKIKKSELL